MCQLLSGGFDKIPCSDPSWIKFLLPPAGQSGHQFKGMAYGSGVVMLLTLLKLMQRRTEPSGFLTGTIGLDQGLRMV